jgi:hypothetical protein
MRIVVTGATGNVGTAVLRALAADERVQEIVGLARRLPDWQNPRTRWVRADVAADPLEPHFAGADAVIHLAWLIQPSRDGAELERVNVAGSRRVFEAAAQAGAGALVHASSVGAYASGPKDRAVDESAASGDRRDAVEGHRAVTKVANVGDGEREVEDVARTELRPHEHEPLGVAVGERPQEHTIDDAEDGRAGADAQRDGQRRDCGEDRALAERASGVGDIPKERIHPTSSGRVPRRRADRWLRAKRHILRQRRTLSYVLDFAVRAG